MWGIALAAATAFGGGPNFEWIEAEQVGRTLIVDYVRERGPIDAGAAVRLVVVTPNGRFSMPASVGRRRGQWTFPRLPRGIEWVEVRCPRGCMVRDLPIRSLSVGVASVSDAPRPQPTRPPRASVTPVPRPAWAAEPSVIRACERTFISDRAELRCLEMASEYVVNPVSSIEACGHAFVGSASELACVAAAAQAPRNPGAAIQACGQAFTSSRDELECVRRAVVDPAMSPSVVEACGRAFVSSNAELNCIDLGLQRPGRAPEVIQSCDRSFVGESEQLQCIQTALPPGPRR
ncbi:MAG: hypothetical protein AAGA48_32360 [Myxococcota bacterium]